MPKGKPEHGFLIEDQEKLATIRSVNAKSQPRNGGKFASREVVQPHDPFGDDQVDPVAIAKGRDPRMLIGKPTGSEPDSG